MRLYSTPESALNLEVTKLAIIECLASVGLYVYIGVHLGTFRYLALAVVGAPLMLFRTDTSAEWGLRVWGQLLAFVIDLVPAMPPAPGLIRKTFTLICAFFALCFMAVGGVGIRIASTLYWAIREPLRTVREIPRNWLRQSFCTDFLHAPEIVPMEAAKGDPAKVFTFKGVFLEGLQDADSKALAVLLVSPLLLLGYLPAAIYRISFKATAVAYAPLIWVARTTLENPLPLKTRLERVTKGEMEKARRWLSGITAATLAAKAGLSIGWVDLSKIEAKFPSRKFVESFVVLGSWPWWQVTLGLDALLTFFLLFFADAALARVDTPQPWGEANVTQTVSAISFLRGTLAILTASHFFLVAFADAGPWLMFRFHSLVH
jgi:hypothetical protein